MVQAFVFRDVLGWIARGTVELGVHGVVVVIEVVAVERQNGLSTKHLVS